MPKQDYIIQPLRIADRVEPKVYERAQKQTEWEPVDPKEVENLSTCGNVRPVWDKTKKKFVFKDVGFLNFDKYPF